MRLGANVIYLFFFLSIYRGFSFANAEAGAEKANEWDLSFEKYIQSQTKESQNFNEFEKTELWVFPGINSENEKEDSYLELQALAKESDGSIDLQIYWPDSLRPVLENARGIIERLETKVRRWKNSDSKLLLVGHSKGGVELLLACMMRPELCNSEAVALVVVLQAPVMGTTTADELFNEAGQPLTFFKILFSVMPSVNSKIVLGAGMHSVTSQSLNETYKTFDFNFLNETLQKVVFIAGQEKRENWSKELRVPQRNFVGDGIVPLAQARHPLLTSNLSYALNCDHLDLVIKEPRSNKEEAYRKLFWKGLLKLRESLLDSEF